MADVNPPVGEGGGEKLAAEARKALARETRGLKDAKKSVPALEATAEEIKALRRRLSKSMKGVVDAIGKGETPELGRNAGSTLSALERHGILEPAAGGGRDLTRLGRQVAGLEQVAERYAADSTKAVARGLKKGKLKAAPELSKAQTQMMQDYLAGGRGAVDARKALEKAGILGSNSFVGAIERMRERSTQPGAASHPTVGTQQWVKQMQEALKRPGFKADLAPGYREAIGQGLTGKDFESFVQAANRQAPRITYASNPEGRKAEAAAKKAEAAAQKATAPVLAKDAPAVEKAEKAKTTAVETGTKKRKAARQAEAKDINKALGDSAKEVNAAAEAAQASTQAAVARAKAHNAAAKTGAVPAVNSAEHEKLLAEERAADAAKQRALLDAKPKPEPKPRKPPAYVPGTDIIRHPTEFGRRVPGPFGPDEAARAAEAAARQAAYRAQQIPAGGLDVTRKGGLSTIKTSASELGTRGAIRQHAKELERAARAQATATSAAADAANRLGNEQKFVADTARHVEASQAAATRGLQYTAVGFESSSQAMTRHGYLTSEAIEAAKRGELNYKQWGQQIGGTAAKFAGWTAVSIPVFAALDGVRRIGEGAIASSSGVQKLQRYISEVDGQRLQSQVRGLAGTYNVPVEEAANAVARMGQVFKDQDSAVKGGAAVLASFKTGGIDVETGAKNLTAIVNGFGLAGSDLASVFDQINQAQNTFSVSIGDTQAGVAKAAGTFANAGGSLSFLLSLIATGKLQTGRTGENIGTAIQRSVGFIQRPSNQEELKAFGIDPSAGIEAVYTQAFQIAQSLQGKELQRLATAISSPQYASYFVPILKGYQRFQDIQAGTSPAASAGSAQRELAQVTSQLDEQIARIGVRLQQLGSNLAQGGFLVGVKGVVFALDSVLSLANRLLDAFNQLPAPLKTSVALLLQARGAIGLARRVGLGEGLRGGRASGLAGYLVESPARLQRRGIEKGLRSGVEAARDEQERITKDARRAASERNIAYSVQRQTTADVDRRVAAGAISEAEAHEAKLLAAQRVAAADQAALAATLRSTAALQQTAAAEAQALRYRTGSVAAGRSGRNAFAESFAAREGVYRPAELRGPNSLAPVGVGTRWNVPGSGPTGGAPEGEARRLSANANAEMRRVRATFAETRQSAGAARAAAAAASVAWVRSSTVVSTAAKGIGGALKAAAVGLAGMLGPFGLLLAGGLAVGAIVGKVREDARKAREQAERDTALAHRDIQGNKDYRGVDTRAAVAERRRELVKRRAEIPDRRIITSGKAGTPSTVLLPPPPEAVALDRAIAREDRRRRAQVDARRHGNLVPHLTRDAIAQRVDRDFEDAKTGVLTFAELKQHISQRLRELPISRLKGEDIAKTAERIRARLQAAAPTNRSFTEQLYQGTGGNVSAIPQTRLHDPLDGLQAVSDAGLATREQLKNYATIQLAIIARNSGKKTPGGQQAYATAVSTLQSTLRAAADVDRASALALAKTDAEKERIYRDYAGAVTAAANRSSTAVAKIKLAGLREKLSTAEALLREAKRYARVKAAAFKSIADQISEVQRLFPGVFQSVPERVGPVKSDEQARVDALGEGVAHTKKQIERTKAGIKRLRKATDQQADLFQDAVDVAGTVAEDNSEAIQEQAAMIQAQADYRQAQGDGGAQVQGLKRLIAFYQANPDTFKPSQIIQLRAQLLRAVVQRTREDIESRFDLRASRTDNPVKLADLEVRKAVKLRAAGGFESDAERRRASANVNRTRRDKAGAIADRRIENLALDEEIGRITTQQEIAGLQRILKIANLGTEKKRQIKQQILRLKHDINQENALDLDVGNIRLPTTYEIRRLVKGERRGINLTQSYATTVHVASNVDIPKFGDEMEKTHKGANKAIAAATGLY